MSEQAPAPRFTGLVILSPEQTLSPEAKEVRENLVAEAEHTLAAITKHAAMYDKTAAGLPIVQGTGKEEVDRVRTSHNTEMVVTQYGSPGLYLGSEGGRPLCRLIEVDDEGASQVTTVIGCNPLLEGVGYAADFINQSVVTVTQDQSVASSHGLEGVYGLSVSVQGDGDIESTQSVGGESTSFHGNNVLEAAKVAQAEAARLRDIVVGPAV